VPDVFKNKGPMGGIYSVMQQSNFSNYIVASCDAPFIKKELLDMLLNEDCNTAVVSKWNNKSYPFPGIYNKCLESTLLTHLEKNKLKLKDFLNSINAKEVEINPQLKWMNKNVFLNINTPEEYKNLYPCN
jgi:molybdopterin-guanine dinucleotide biosynthesis protein A